MSDVVVQDKPETEKGINWSDLKRWEDIGFGPKTLADAQADAHLWNSIIVEPWGSDVAQDGIRVGLRLDNEVQLPGEVLLADIKGLDPKAAAQVLLSRAWRALEADLVELALTARLKLEDHLAKRFPSE
jgi:hypothetical protein